MRKVTRLEPVQPLLQPKKRVAAYARVSMETERLQHSLSAQISHYNDYIQKNPDWLFAGVYSDNAVSGTGTARRDGFNRMIADCDAGKIDIILTKSISRFARNTVDLLEVVRHLKDIGVEVWFEKENIHSLDGDGELMLSILASFAQEESRSISDNVKWGTRKRFEEGIPNGRFRIYGYRWEGEELVVVPEEAAVVRRIYQNFLDGKSRLETEREFAAEGILTRGGHRWTDSNIKLVLCNITYTGDLLLQKEYISDPISKKRRKNTGELPQYFVESHHEAIIDRSVWTYVQEEMARRRKLGPLANKALNTSCFTGKIKCAKCGQSMVRNTRANKAARSLLGDKLIGWVCASRKKKGGRCTTKEIPDRILRSETAAALGMGEFDETAFLERVEKITVPENGVLTFCFKDGRVMERRWNNTSKRDSWTDEAKERASAYRREHSREWRNACCFTGTLKCGHCGCNFRGALQKSGINGGKVRYWRCAEKNGCATIGLREDRLRQICADVMDVREFDEDAFKNRVSGITVDSAERLTFHMTDGSEVMREWNPRWRRGQ